MASSAADRKSRKVSKSGDDGDARKKLDVDKVLGVIVSMLTKHKPGDLTISKISKATGVPRPTLYYYFGKSLNSIIDEAAKYAMKRMVVMYERTDMELDAPTWHDFQKARFKKAIELVRKYPWVPGLYLRYRDILGDSSSTIRRMEDEYGQYMVKAWKHYHGTEINFRALRVTSYLKIGILVGMASEQNSWQDQGALDQLIQDFTNTLTDYMRNDYGKV